MSPLTVEDLLRAARARLRRLDVVAANEARLAGATLVDIRGDAQIWTDGMIPGALVIPRNVLEWRLDPACEYRHPSAPDLDAHVVVVCDEGYQSSLVAATLQDFGFRRATDVDGGFQAWRGAGLPIEPFGTSAHGGRAISVRDA